MTRRTKTAAALRHSCPTCDARPGRPCRSLRTPGPNTLGGGWGGPPTLDRPHRARYQAAAQGQAHLEAVTARREALKVITDAPGAELRNAPSTRLRDAFKALALAVYANGHTPEDLDRMAREAIAEAG